MLLGGRGNRIENNRIYGNFLTGVAAVESILLTEEPAGARARAQHRPQQPVRPQRHRRQRQRRHVRRQRHRQLLLDGGVTSTFPADGSTFAGCAGRTRSAPSVQQQMIGLIGENAVNGWNKHPHPPKAGYTPLEVFG